MNIIYLNGKFIPKAEGKISVFDRGFLFGDGIYEVIPIYKRKPIGLEFHLQRLERSLQAIEIPSPYSIDQWRSILKGLAQSNKLDHHDFGFYIQITRGATEERAHEYSNTLVPTVMVCCKPMMLYGLDTLAQGFKAIVIPDDRREQCYVKSINLLPNVLAYQQAARSGAIEAILIKNEHAVEASQSNLFIVKNGVLITPPLTPKILAGITRHIILQLAKENNIPYQERNIEVKELYDADEVWVTGSSKEICPITRLNDQILRQNAAGPFWHQMHLLYQTYKQTQTSLW
jgi:D-alanine transaminase